MTGMLVSGLILRFAKNLLGSEDPSERTLVQLVSYGAMTVALIVGYAIAARIYSRATQGDRLGRVITRTFERLQGKERANRD